MKSLLQLPVSLFDLNQSISITLHPNCQDSSMHETKHCPTIIPRFSSIRLPISKARRQRFEAFRAAFQSSSQHFEVTSGGQRCYVTPANGSNTTHDIVHFVDRLSRYPLSLVSVHRDRRASREKRSTVSRHFHRPFIDPRKWNEPTKFRGDRDGWTVIENLSLNVVRGRQPETEAILPTRGNFIRGECIVHSRDVSNIVKGLS